MGKRLIRNQSLWHFSASEKIIGPHSNLIGGCSHLRGDCSNLNGCCTGLIGDCSKLSGNIDSCNITEDERKEGIDILFLVAWFYFAKFNHFKELIINST